MSLPGGVAGQFVVAQVDAAIAVGMVLFTGLFALVGVGLVVFGGLTVWTGIQMRRADPDTVTDAAAGGRVTLAGTARTADRTLTAPLSGEECLAYDYRVQRYSSGGEGSSWKTVESGEEGVGFVLDCDDGEVFVDADRDPKFVLSDDSLRVTVGSDEDPPESIRRYLADESTPDETDPVAEVGPVSIGGQRRRYRENRLVPGEGTFVAGVARDRTSATGSAPRGVAAVVGPPDVSGWLDRLRRRRAALPFTVADGPPSEAATGQLLGGGILLLIGAPWLLISLFGVLSAVVTLLGFLAGG